MSRVLIVEDSPTQARQIGFMLEEAGLVVETAANGREALKVIERDALDIVLTDLQMPEMNGLQLVEAVRTKYPLLPVILMTAHGSEEIAVQALHKGAASYVPKSRLDQDLVLTVLSVLALARADRRQQELLSCLAHIETTFCLENAPTLFASLVAYLQDNMSQMNLCDENGLIRIGIALNEALVNALYHGNLELSSELCEQEGRTWDELAVERRQQSPYRDRRIHINARLSRSEAVYVVRDEGPGFDPSTLPDPKDPASIEKPSGRGILLIHTFMDDVSFNNTGNEITMFKRRQ